MFRIEAPYPAPSTTAILPSPQWGDSRELVSAISTMHTMNGTLYTYIKRKKARKKLVWDFEIARNKALELRAFFNIYYRTKVRIIDHDNVTWIGYLINNPFEFTGKARALGFPGNETMNVTIEFEEAD